MQRACEERVARLFTREREPLIESTLGNLSHPQIHWTVPMICWIIDAFPLLDFSAAAEGVQKYTGNICCR